MASYRAKGINKFTFVNLGLLDSDRIGRIFLLAAFNMFTASNRWVSV
jgi:hypothetical protein